MPILTARNIPEPEPTGPSWWVKGEIDDKAALALCDQYYDMQKRDLIKHAFERMWYITILFLLGYQMVPRAGQVTTIQANPFPVWKRRYITNRLLPMLMRQVSRMTTQPVGWDVIPNSPDVADQQAAAVAKSFLYAQQKPIGLEDARSECAFWACALGKGFIGVEWDDWAGGSTRVYMNPLQRDPQTGQPTPIPSESLQPEQRAFLDQNRWYVEKPSGDIRVSAVSPFEIVVPVLATRSSIDSAPWLMRVRQETADWCWNRFDPARLKDVRPDRDVSLSNYYQRRLKTIIAMFGYFTGFEEREEKEELITVRELWLPPTKRLPDGRRIVCSRDHVLVNEPHPLKDQRIKYPFAAWDYSKLGDRFWSKGMLEDMLHPQAELNRSRSVVHQIRDLMGQPKWAIEKGSGISMITSEPGQNVFYNKTSRPPVPIVAAMDHTLHENIVAHVLDDMNTQAAQSDVTQAKIPPSVRSGVAIQSLQEKDDSVIGPTIRSGELCMETVGQHVLKFAARHYTDYRLIAMHGQERAADILYFRGSDLRNNDRVHIKSGSLMPKSAASTSEKTLELIQLGVLNPQTPQHARIIAKALDFGYMEPLFIELEADERRAEIENDMFRNPNPEGRMPIVRPWDNHMTHMEIHNRFRKSDTYEMAPPEIQAAVDAHCQIHEEFISQMLEMQQAQTLTAKGAPGEKGEASQPSKSQPTPGTEAAA